MDWKKVLKWFYGNGGNNGNKGVLPERGKGTAPAPKSQPKTIGKELYEITEKVNAEVEQVAREEAEVLLHALCIKDRFVKEANKGNDTYTMPFAEFEELMKKNNLRSDIYDLINSMWDLLHPMNIYINSRQVGEEKMVVFRWYK